jgi:hypothetical protein
MPEARFDVSLNLKLSLTPSEFSQFVQALLMVVLPDTLPEGAFTFAPHPQPAQGIATA